MGWLAKLVAVFVCLAALGFGFWFISALCILYLLLSSRPRGKNVSTGPMHHMSISRRFLIAGGLALLSILARASGGRLSPVLFLLLGSAVLLWPYLPASQFLLRVTPTEGSILLRAAYFPFAWHCIAEVKPGSEDLPRALSSFSGRLILVRRTGKIYAQTTTFAPDGSGGEAHTILRLKEAASSLSPGSAFLLPLDARQAYELFSLKLSGVRTGRNELPDQKADLIVLETGGGFVRGAGAYMVVGRPQSGASLPALSGRPRGSPLLWEVLQSMGKTNPWPAPDAFSNLLQSIVATQGEPIGERLNALDISGSGATVSALGGDRLALANSQLRAIVALYR
jgi:hypothetical protein